MSSQQLQLTKLIEAIGHVLNVFNFPNGASMIERAAANRGDDPNNIQLLANLKQELGQLPPLTTINMSDEMRCFVQALIESTKATNEMDKKFVTRSINKLYNAFEPFARNEIQRMALIDMQIAKEEVLDVEPRHRVAHKLKNPPEERLARQEGDGNEELHMTRELKAADY